MKKQSFFIPVIAPYMPPTERDFPVTQKENLMLAFDHEKPYWMPSIHDATQWVFPPAFQDIPEAPDHQTTDSVDWFGTVYKYEAAQSGSTPMPGVFEEVTEWEEKVKWPDLDKVDWARGLDTFVRDESKALSTRLGNGIFERLHAFESFEQSLIDVLDEQEECKRFFDKMGQYKIDCARYMQKYWHFDYMTHNDDWANAKAQFFSLEVFEKTLLDSAIAVADAIHEMGCRYMVHCCGKMDVFVPYLVNDIHADVLEIQTIVDIRGILDQYAAKVTPVYCLDPYIMYDPDTTEEQAREYARWIVDNYGAHTCGGAGVIVRMAGNKKESYYAFEDELYNYSTEKYKAFH